MGYGRSISRASNGRWGREPVRCSSSTRTIRPAHSSRRRNSNGWRRSARPRGIALIVDEVFADYELEPDDRGGSGASARPRRRARVRPGRIVEVGWAAAAQARMDRRRRPGRAGGRGDRAARADLRHLPLGVDARPAGGGGVAGPRCRRARPDRGPRRGQLRPAEGAGGVDALVERPDRLGRLVRGGAGANVAIGRGPGGRPRDVDGVAGASRLFLRLSAASPI